MAKYSRFDPRNKKQSRNKQRSIDKDIRIRYEENKKYDMNMNVNNIMDRYNDYEEEQEEIHL